MSGDKQSVLEAGSFAYIPRGTLHTFKNIANRQGRMLVIITPAGLEEFFYAIGTQATDLTSPPTFDHAMIDKLMQLAGNYELEILMPNKE